VEIMHYEKEDYKIFTKPTIIITPFININLSNALNKYYIEFKKIPSYLLILIEDGYVFVS